MSRPSYWTRFFITRFKKTEGLMMITFVELAILWFVGSPSVSSNNQCPKKNFFCWRFGRCYYWNNLLPLLPLMLHTTRSPVKIIMVPTSFFFWGLLKCTYKNFFLQAHDHESCSNGGPWIVFFFFLKKKVINKKMSKI